LKLSPQSIEQLKQCLESCDVILTPNKRLAQQLLPLVKKTLAADLQSDAWIANVPEIMPFDQWVSNCYQSALLTGQVDPGMVLSVNEEQVLWQEVINEYAEREKIPVVSSIVSEAQKACALLDDYRIDMESSRFLFESLPDARIFRQWVEALELKLVGKGLTTQTKASRNLLNIKPHSAALTYALVGFEKLTPLQHALLAHYSGAGEADGESVRQLDLSCNPRQYMLGAVEDSDGELKMAARWAKRWQLKDPGARVAVIVADLGQNRLKAQRIFQQVFAPGDSLENSVGRFNISMGCPLKSTEPVSVALGLLRSFIHRIPLPEWNLILTSGYFAFSREYRQLANRILRAMYASGEAEFEFVELTPLHDWYSVVGKLQQEDSLNDGIDILLSCNRVVRESRKPQAKALVSDWVKMFSGLLEKLGWPQTGTLGSVEYQQYQSFIALVDSLTRYDRVVGEVSLSGALRILSQVTHSTIFQPETSTGSQEQAVPQVLGLLEALGQNFDAVWLTGMSDQQWPQTINPNAFIPLQLQIEHGMPASSVEAELNYAKGVSRRLLLCASEEMVISYPATIDEAETRCSAVLEECILDLDSSLTEQPLTIKIIRDLFDEMVSDLTDAPELSTLTGQGTLELIGDYYGKPWELSEEEAEKNKPCLPGGVSTLKEIANNPLRAYARQRLGIESVYPPTSGIRAYERGNIVHGSLDLFWSEIQDSVSLKALDIPSRKILIRNHIEQAMRGVFAARYRQPRPEFLEMESEALTELLLAWLTIDAGRPGFTVCATEHGIEFELAQCRIRGRIDRIECLDNHRLVLADYKTGTLLSPKWQLEPLVEPQLPLYMLALGEQVSSDTFHVENESKPDIAGIYFAGIKPGYVKCIGLTDDAALSKSMAGVSLLDEDEDWSQLQQRWKIQIEDLAAKTLQGYAGYDPEIHEAGKRYESFVRSRFVYYVEN